MKDREVDLQTMEGIFGVHLGLAHSVMVQDFKRELEPLQLTPKQTALLWLADESPGIAQADVARVFRVDRATVLAITKLMVKRGFVSRQPPRDGGRRIGLHLTESGREVLDQARRAIARHERRLTRNLTPDEVAVATALLKRIYG